MHDKNLNFQPARKKIAFIYDDMQNVKKISPCTLPPDASAEWETPDTIQHLCGIWESLNFDVVKIPLNKMFFSTWDKHFRTLEFVHSVVEGWGSVNRESWISELCELSGVPCIGSSPHVITLTMNKHECKKRMRELGVPVTTDFLVRSVNECQEIIQPNLFPGCYFIKPNFEGSSMGIYSDSSMATSQEQLKECVLRMLQKFPEGVLIEPHLEGPEYTVGVIHAGATLTPAEISVTGGLYGAEQKGKDERSECVTFLNPQHPHWHNLIKYSALIFKGLCLEDYARIDWKTDTKGRLYALEINALPGLSPHYSVLPEILAHHKMNLRDLFRGCAERAYSKKNHRPYRYGRWWSKMP